MEAAARTRRRQHRGLETIRILVRLRALIQRSVHDRFVEKLLALAETARMGNPLETMTQVGPITTQPQYQKVLDYIRIAKDEGARCVLGGSAASRPECGAGWFIEPTIF